MKRSERTRAGDLASVVIREGDRTRMVEMHWGFEPSDGRKQGRFLVRDDSGEIDHFARCLIPATALPLTSQNGRKWIVTLEQPHEVFCFAGVWMPARTSWPDAYAAVTVPAYADLKLIKRRHVAILLQSSWGKWLAAMPTASVLKPLPSGSLKLITG